MTKWPVLDGDPDWDKKLSQRWIVLGQRIHRRMKRFRGKNRESFVAELKQLRADYNAEYDRLSEAMKTGSYVVAKTTGKGRPAATLESTAENLGTALGQVAARLDAWKRDRAAISADIQSLLKAAQVMLGDLGGQTTKRASALLGGAMSNKGGRPKGYVISTATKAKLRAAWKRRKAAAKATKAGVKAFVTGKGKALKSAGNEHPNG